MRGLAQQLLLLLLLSTTLAGGASNDADMQLQQLRHAAQQQPHNPLPHVQLALALHELNHQRPDGGSRVPEAEQAYRWVGVPVLVCEGEDRAQQPTHAGDRNPTIVARALLARQLGSPCPLSLRVTIACTACLFPQLLGPALGFDAMDAVCMCAHASLQDGPVPDQPAG